MDIFKEWNTRTPWKERKNVKKLRGSIDSRLVPGHQDPELIFYGRHKTELYEIASDNELLKFGNDQVDSLLALYFRKKSTCLCVIG